MSEAAVADSGLYERDFYAWTREQAVALREVAATRVNAAIDWDNVIEEIESLGSEQEHALWSHLRLIIVHCLKLAYEPDENPHRHWRAEVAAQRSQLENRIRKNPSLRPRLPDVMSDAYRAARKEVEVLFNFRRGTLPDQCPYTVDQLRDEDWFPDPRKDEPNA